MTRARDWDEWDERARALGHDDLKSMLEATRDLTHAGVGRLFGVSKTVAATLRRRYDIPAPNFAAVDRLIVTAKRRPDPYRTLPAYRPRVPPGVQPQDGDRIQCLDCGKWYRALGNHLRQMHAMRVPEYQEEFGLPASRGLVAEDLREVMAENSRRRLQTEEGLREKLTTDREVLAERARKGRESRAGAGHRAANLQAWRQAAADAGAKRSDDLRVARDEWARAGGHADFAGFLEATAHLPAKEVGALTGEGILQIAKLRRRYGVASTAVEHAVRARREARERALAPPDVEPGVQPEADGRMQCLECSQWYRSLGAHVRRIHQLDARAYRAKHALARDEPLCATDFRESIQQRLYVYRTEHPAMLENYAKAPTWLDQHRDKAIAASRAASKRPEVRAMLQESIARATREHERRARQRHDLRAQELGHADLPALLAATAHLTQREVGAMLGVSGSQVGRLRHAEPLS